MSCTTSGLRLPTFWRVILLCTVFEGSQLRAGQTANQASGRQPPRTRQQVKFCIATLPARFHIDIGTRQLTGGANHFVRFESPFGELLSPNGAVWSTNQFCLDYWFWHQFTRMPGKTICDQADVVYVPFLMGQTGEDDAVTEAWREMDTNLTTLLPMVHTKPHLFVLPRTEWVSRGRLQEESYHLLDRDQRYNLTFLTIEVFKPVWERRTGLRNILPMPYPTWFHHHDGLNIESWAADAVNNSKTLLAIQSFDPRYDFRARLKAACLSIPSICHHQDFSYWSQGNATHILTWLNATASAWYCLSPPGDSPTRKAIFDCLMSGTIPVVFDDWVPFTFPYHDIVNASELMVVLPWSWTNASEVTGIYSQVLAGIPVVERLAKIARIKHFQQVLQYSLTPKTGDLRFDTLYELQPTDDAFTFSLKAVLRNLCARGLLNGRCKMHAITAAGTNEVN